MKFLITSLDVYSTDLVCFLFQTRFPVELRVITDHDEITRSEEGVGLDWNTLIVRRYLINECDEVTILASGDIEYNEVQFGLVQLNVKSGGTVEKFCKTKKPIGLSLPRFYASALSKAAAALEKLTRYPLDNYKNQKYGKIKDGPIPIESTPVSGYIESEPEVKFWDREKKMVQNAFICSQVRIFVKTKGSLISESFFTLAQTSKKVPNHKVDRAQDRDLAPFWRFESK